MGKEFNINYIYYNANNLYLNFYFIREIHT